MKIYVVNPKNLRVVHIFDTLTQACAEGGMERFPGCLMTEARDAVGAIAGIINRLKVTGEPIPPIKDILPRFAARQVAAA